MDGPATGSALERRQAGLLREIAAGTERRLSTTWADLGEAAPAVDGDRRARRDDRGQPAPRHPRGVLSGNWCREVFSREQPATATVRQCERAGPVSGNGFGYWWECDVAVRMRDGRTVETAVGHSVVTPDDQGRRVDFREACFGANNTKCHYGRPTWLLWGIAVSILGMVKIAVTSR
ncbi:DUF6346 domain-containing protein [Micromonospora purpureochromogenes]|uniref:DUF6346 domain-containing protein n=1 Tax=Micromonospora purpureochromogenes TaxID=47872 RepID=UPI0036360588